MYKLRLKTVIRRLRNDLPKLFYSKKVGHVLQDSRIIIEK